MATDIRVSFVEFAPVSAAVNISWAQFDPLAPAEDHRSRRHRPHILPLADGCTIPIVARTSTGVWLKKPQGYVTPTSYVPTLQQDPLPPIVHTPVPFVRDVVPPRTGAAPALRARGAVLPGSLRGVAGAETVQLLCSALKSRGYLRPVAAGAGTCKLVLTNRSACAMATPKAVTNPTDEEIVTLLLAARRRNKLTRRKSLW